jgi:hypothetical protein
MVRKMEPTLNIGDGPDATSPQAISELIGQLLRTSDAIGPSFKRGILAERVLVMDTADAIVSGRLDAMKITHADDLLPADPAEVNRLLQESIPGDVLHLLDDLTQAADAVSCSGWPAAQKMFAPPLDLRADSKQHLFARTMMFVNRARTEVRFRAATDLRVAAIALAIRWYQADHHGELPSTLQVLAPKYLPAVPADPMAADDAPLHYVAQGPDPRIYSLCVDGTDGEGKDIGLSQQKNRRKWSVTNHLLQRPRDTSHLPASLKD